MTSMINDRRRKLLAYEAAIAACAVAPARAAQPLLFGTTPVFLDEQAQFLRAWQNWLESRLGSPVRFVQRASYQEIMELLLAGRLDVAWVCGYPYVRHRRELELVAVPIRSLNWLLSSPKITEVVIGSDGAPAPMVCADPRSFALHKLWLSSQLSRDPLKKSRDHAQAMAVASMVIDKMPHLLFDANDLKNFPKAISEDTDGSEFSALRKAFKL